MIKYIVAFGFFLVAFVFMAWSLHFSQYKKRNSGCCSDSLEDFEKSTVPSESCDTCPNKN